MLSFTDARTHRGGMSDSSELAPLWLTAKARINSERRLRSYAVLSHLLLTWYAFWTIVFSVYQDNVGSKIGPVEASKLGIILSVLTFGLSLVISGFKFEERASVYRGCYLKLQALYRSNAQEDKLSIYHQILEHYPNHSNGDNDRVIFDGWLRAQPVSNSKGQIPVTRILLVSQALAILFKWILGIALFAAPPSAFLLV